MLGRVGRSQCMLLYNGLLVKDHVFYSTILVSEYQL